MAGSKPTDQEKSQILDLVRQGYNVEEIQSRFPHIDGRSISGIHVRYSRRQPSPQVNADTPPVSQAPQATPVYSQSAVDYQKTPQQEASEVTGFTPYSTVAHTPQGFKPGYREYFVVKKLDPPGDGVMKTEYPPFGIQELMERYAPGDYEIQHYREGRLFNTYREKIAVRNVSGAPLGHVVQEPRKPDSPADTFLKAMDIYHRMHSEGKIEAAQVKAAEIQAHAQAVQAKAQVEQAATVGLIDLVKELGRPKSSVHEASIDRLFALMQEDRKTIEKKLENEIAIIRERAKADLEIERERLRAEIQRAREEAEERLKRERLFMEKMSELDKDRQALWKESYDNMVAEIKGMSEALSRELEEKRRWLDQYNELQKSHVDEIISLKKSLSNGGDSIEMARIIKDGIVAGLDRVGARIDMLADKGVIGKMTNPSDATKIEDVSRKGESLAKEDKMVMTREAIEAAVHEPWFQDLQSEISRTVRRRKSIQDLSLRPHGSLLGQAFIDRLNEDPSLRKYMHYLISRDWKEVLEDAEPGIRPENKEILHDPEAEMWFSEFQAFLSRAWNASIGISG